MKNIVVRDGADRWEFIHTPDLGDRSSIRVRNLDRPDGHWSLTGEARHSATQSFEDEDRTRSREEPNTLPRPTVPEHVIDTAVKRAGAGASFKVWP